MNYRILLFTILIIFTAFVSYKATYAFFTSNQVITGNTITTASVFPTPSISPTSTVTVTPTITITPSPTPTVNTGDVVINELMWGGSDDEWIELRNMTLNTVDISNWTIENAGSGTTSINIPGSQSIAPNGFYLIAENKNTSKINVDPDHPTAAVSLLDDGEILNLRDASNQVIDTANATPGWLEGSSSAPRKTMERKDTPGDGTVSTNWQTATTHTNMDGNTTEDEFGTPRAAND